MPFPSKYRHLIELGPEDVEAPDYVALNYAVCVLETHSCGWGGWIVEAAFRKTDESYPTGTGDRCLTDDLIPVCPRCGRDLFRTGATIWLAPTTREALGIGPPFECEVVPDEYCEDPDALLAEEILTRDWKLATWSSDSEERDHDHCEVCSRRISAYPYEIADAYTDGKSGWLCPRCYDRVSRAGRS